MSLAAFVSMVTFGTETHCYNIHTIFNFLQTPKWCHGSLQLLKRQRPLLIPKSQKRFLFYEHQQGKKNGFYTLKNKPIYSAARESSNCNFLKSWRKCTDALHSTQWRKIWWRRTIWIFTQKTWENIAIVCMSIHCMTCCALTTVCK